MITGVVVVSICAALLLAACGGDGGAALRSLQAQSESVSFDRVYDSLPELVGQVEGSADGSELVVVGTVTRVEPGASYRWNVTPDGDDRIDLPYGHPETETASVFLGRRRRGDRTLVAR